MYIVFSPILFICKLHLLSMLMITNEIAILPITLYVPIPNLHRAISMHSSAKAHCNHIIDKITKHMGFNLMSKNLNLDSTPPTWRKKIHRKPCNRYKGKQRKVDN